jgi:hypothetical protein
VDDDANVNMEEEISSALNSRDAIALLPVDLTACGLADSIGHLVWRIYLHCPMGLLA